MLQAASTHTLEFEAERIVDELAEQAREQLGDNPPEACLVFSAIDVDHQAIAQGLQEVFGGIELIGASTDGELSSVQGFQQDSVTAIFLASDELDFAVGVGDKLATDPAAATERAVEQARQKLDGEPSLCVTTPSGLQTNSTLLMEGLQSQLGETMPIVGGLAGDQLIFERTFQYAGDRVFDDAVPVLLISGSISISHGVASGWAPLGDRVTIEKADGNVVYEIGDQTAVEFYRHYIGDGDINDGVYPLALYEEDGEDFYLRAPVGYDEGTGSVTFFGGVTSGDTAQITRAERTAVIEGTRKSVKSAYEAFDDDATPRACLVFSCAGRHQVLGSQTSREYDILKEVVSEDIEVCGFYTYGELAPLSKGSPSRFHNDTFITVLLG